MLAGLGPPHAISSFVISVHHPPPAPSHPSLLCRRMLSVDLCNDGSVTSPRTCGVVWVRRVDAGTVGTRRQLRGLHRHVHCPFLPVHHDRVAKLYAVELRVGDGVREKSGRGGVARSRPNGRSSGSEDGEAHAWLGPGGGALLGPASPDLTVMPSSSPSPPLPRNFSKYLALIFSYGGLYAALPAMIEVSMPKKFFFLIFQREACPVWVGTGPRPPLSARPRARAAAHTHRLECASHTRAYRTKIVPSRLGVLRADKHFRSDIPAYLAQAHSQYWPSDEPTQ